MNDDEILDELDELLANTESDDEFGFDGKYLDYYNLMLYNKKLLISHRGSSK